MAKHVWEFTNQKKLTKKEFIRYVEKKIWKTIRKYRILPNDKVFKLTGRDLNANVLKHVLSKKFTVKKGKNISTFNLSDVAERVFREVLKGNFEGKEMKELKPEYLKAPLYDLLDEEIELYAKLESIKGKPKQRDARIQELFKPFKERNPDLEHNIVNAFLQL
ncbi:MAG: hypothetical protein ACP5D2_03085 [Candidatus Nanoarchaeia archaeon]